MIVVSYSRWSLNVGSVSFDLRRVFVSEQWSLTTGGLSIQVVSNTDLTMYRSFKTLLFHKG